MEVKGKRVLVVGLGKSGVASALFLASRGALVTVSDAKREDQLRKEIPALLDRGITVETGKHGERTFANQDLIVVSPGVPGGLAALQHARKLGIPIIGEIELTARFLEGKIIAITGSNGKTTTTTLTGEIIASGGRKTLVGETSAPRPSPSSISPRPTPGWCWRSPAFNWSRSRPFIRISPRCST